MSDLPRLAYLTSRYPAASHTFILREIAALRQLGFSVETCSMRQPTSDQLTGPEEHAAFDTTYYLVENGRNPLVMLAAIGHALRRPARLLRTLGLTFRTAAPGLKGSLKQLAYLAEALVLSRHLDSRGVAHLHNHFADPSATITMLCSCLTGIPFSYTIHGPADFYEPQTRGLRTKTARATFVACISNFARAQAMHFSDPAHWPKLRIVHCGVVQELYAQTEGAETPRGAQPVRLLFVGRVAPVKGIRVLLAALEGARTTHSGLQLTIIGDGEDRAHLEKLAAPLGSSVSFVGYRSQGEIAQALATADMFVLPSFAEGVPVVLMEAMAAGKPVIATAVGGVGELVEDGVSGFMVPPGDVETLQARICTLAEDADLRARMGARGREKVRNDFDARIEAARIGALFAGRGGPGVRPEPLDAPE